MGAIVPSEASAPDEGEAQAAGGSSSGAQRQVWEELFGTVSTLSETIDIALQAFSPENAPESKTVSSTTKRRLLIKSLQQLKQGREGVQVLTEHLRALQAASQQWQRTMMYASKSHEELLEQLESTNRDLYLTSERLRKADAARTAAERAADELRAQVQEMETARKTAVATSRQRDEALETAHFTEVEMQAELSRLRQCAEEAKVDAAEAQQTRDRAVGALDSVRAEAAKATGNAERHQETVARLTADNLVFLMNLKKAEAELAAANQEKQALRLAAEKQRGPWFDQVRTSVEERVRHAMARADGLELELEATRQQHHSEVQDVVGQKADLEEFLGSMRAHEADLEAALREARTRQAVAEEQAAVAVDEAARLQAKVDDLAAEGRVAQESLKAMRVECSERWVSEQGALAHFSQMQGSIASLEAVVAEQQEHGRQLQAALDGQLGINRQLMSKKEEVEWQLMAALTKLDGSGAPRPPQQVGTVSLVRDPTLPADGNASAAGAEPPIYLQQQQQRQPSAVLPPPPLAPVLPSAPVQLQQPSRPLHLMQQQPPAQAILTSAAAAAGAGSFSTPTPPHLDASAAAAGAASFTTSASPTRSVAVALPRAEAASPARAGISSGADGNAAATTTISTSSSSSNSSSGADLGVGAGEGAAALPPPPRAATCTTIVSSLPPLSPQPEAPQLPAPAGRGSPRKAMPAMMPASLAEGKREQHVGVAAGGIIISSSGSRSAPGAGCGRHVCHPAMLPQFQVPMAGQRLQLPDGADPQGSEAGGGRRVYGVVTTVSTPPRDRQ